MSDYQNFQNNLLLFYLVAFSVGYLLCCVHPAYFLTKLIKKEDIRSKGSFNSGASNATIVLGIKFGIITALIDILKGTLAVSLIKSFLSPAPEVLYVCAFGCVIGHMFPFYLNFKGGKSLATLLGVMLALHPLWVVFAGATLVIVTLITQYIAIGTLLVDIWFVVLTYISYGFSFQLAVALAVAFLMIYKHIINFKRIFKGEEIKLFQAVKKK